MTPLCLKVLGREQSAYRILLPRENSAALHTFGVGVGGGGGGGGVL